jgi:hypothetical protein
MQQNDQVDIQHELVEIQEEVLLVEKVVEEEIKVLMIKLIQNNNR